MTLIMICGLIALFSGVFITTSGFLNDAPDMGMAGLVLALVGVYFISVG